MAYDANAVLKASATETSSTNGTGLDTGNGTGINGMKARLLITAASGTSPTMTVNLQHSDDDSTYTTFASFTQATTTGEQFITAETNKRYIRAASTIGGTTPSFTYAVDLGLSKP